MTPSKKLIAPLIIAGLIGGFILFLIWAALQAKNFGPRITDPDYYSKGLRYNTTLVEKRAASVLGWTIKASVENDHLQIRLFDKDSRAVKGANGQLFLYKTQNNDSGSIHLDEIQPGLYAGKLPSAQPGEYRVRIEFESAGARLNRELLLNL